MNIDRHILGYGDNGLYYNPSPAVECKDVHM